MTYIEDLDDSGDPVIRPVGYLDAIHPFAIGDVGVEFLDKLRRLARLAVEAEEPFGFGAMGGVHICELCERFVSTGAVTVPTSNLLYRTPMMIVHYIEVHQYKPPQVFIDAVLACPIPGTQDYAALAIRCLDAIRAPATESEWTFEAEAITGRRGQRFTVLRNGSIATYANILNAWQNEPGFRRRFNTTLAATLYRGFKWETPPITEKTIRRPFEFVLLDAPALDQRPDPRAFAEHFDRVIAGDVTSIAFPNLSGDATLVAPLPISLNSNYGHLAAFVRNAPDEQRDDLWRIVGAQLRYQLSDQPIWLSTAGMGVPWLHVRLDSAPKYYGHQPYAEMSE